MVDSLDNPVGDTLMDGLGEKDQFLEFQKAVSDGYHAFCAYENKLVLAKQNNRNQGNFRDKMNYRAYCMLGGQDTKEFKE